MKRKAFLVVSILVIGFIGLLFGGFKLFEEQQKNTIERYEFANINMIDVKDGTYIGEASSGAVKVKVEVVIKNHNIDNIIILQHENGLGSKAEKIISNMIIENRYDVRVINGATVSSKTIMYAVCNALKNGLSN